MSITTIIIVISGLSIAFAAVAFFNWCRGWLRAALKWRNATAHWQEAATLWRQAAEMKSGGDGCPTCKKTCNELGDEAYDCGWWKMRAHSLKAVATAITKELPQDKQPGILELIEQAWDRSRSDEQGESGKLLEYLQTREEPK